MFSVFAQKRTAIPMIDYFPNYDNWKTTPPEEPEPVEYCHQCGAPMYEGDVLYTIDGGICEDCLRDDYRRIL